MNHIASDVAAPVSGHPGSEYVAPIQMEYVERLSLREQFRLVEIAHETINSEIRSAALKVLGKYLNPLVALHWPSKDSQRTEEKRS